MILVDSSVWIDYFRGSPTRQTDALDQLLGEEPLAVGDLIVTEVLQGFASGRAFREALALFEDFDRVPIGGSDVAVAAAVNHRRLRALGITARKTIDTAIATRCIVSGYALLHDDRDFDAFEQHLGLRCV
jgi:predicted nucleic acid-binding protein